VSNAGIPSHSTYLDTLQPYTGSTMNCSTLDVDLSLLPYPIALMAQHLDGAISSQTHPSDCLSRLKDCFELSFKYLTSVLLAEYFANTARPQTVNDSLLTLLWKPTTGDWFQLVEDLSGLLLIDPQSDHPIARLFKVPAGRKQKLSSTPLFEQLKGFPRFRNDSQLGHGQTSPPALIEQNMKDWIPVLRKLLVDITSLCLDREWRLGRIIDTGHFELWMGPAAPGESICCPSTFPVDSIGHFGIAASNRLHCDLYPFLCCLTDDDRGNYLCLYDSITKYRESRKQALLSDVAAAKRVESDAPFVGLERHFTIPVLRAHFNKQRRETIDGRIIQFTELLLEHSDVVGRRWAIDYVKHFIETHDRGLLVIEGEPGKGKTALMCHLIENEFGHYTPRPVCFFYRRTGGYTNPEKCSESLYFALLQSHSIAEEPSPNQLPSSQEIDGKLADLLSRSIAPRLLPSRPQLILIDALDEAQSSPDQKTAFQRLPENLPAGVYVIVTTRPVADRSILGRRADLHWYDLDSPDLQQDHLRDGLDYIHRHLDESRLPPQSSAEFARLCNGNFLVLTLVVKHARDRMPLQEAHDFIRQLAMASEEDKLGFVYREFWHRMTKNLNREEVNLVCDAAGTLLAARVPITAEMICKCLDISDGDWQFAYRHISEYLTPIEQLGDDQPEIAFRIYHATFADFLSAHVVRQTDRYDGKLASYCTGWRELKNTHGRLYALRYGLYHLQAAANWDGVDRMLADQFFIEEAIAAGFLDDLLENIASISNAVPRQLASGDHVRLIDDPRSLQELRKVLRHYGPFLERHPESVFQCVANRIRLRPIALEAPKGISSPHPGSAYRLMELCRTWEGTSSEEYWVRDALGADIGIVDAEPILFHHGATTGPSCIASSSCGRMVAIALKKEVLVFDTNSGRRLTRLDHEGRIRHICFSGDGSRLACVVERLPAISPNMTFEDLLVEWCVAVWSTNDWRCVRDINCRSGLEAIAFVDDIIVGVRSIANWVEVWDCEVGVLLCEVKHQEEDVAVDHIAISPNGHHFTTISHDRSVRVWDTATGELLGETRIGSGIVQAAFAGTTSLLALSTYDVLYLWDWRPRRLPDGRELMYSFGDWLEPGGRCCPLEEWSAGDGGGAVAFSFDGTLLAVGRNAGRIDIWRLANKPSICHERDGSTTRRLECEVTKEYSFNGHGESSVDVVGFLPTSHDLVTASHDGTAALWDTERLPMDAASRHTDTISDLAFSPRGEFLVTSSFDGSIRFWDPLHGSHLGRFSREGCCAITLRVSEDGSRVATGWNDGSVHIIDAISHGDIASFQVRGPVVQVEFGLNREQVIIRTSYGAILVWNLEDGSTNVLTTDSDRGELMPLTLSEDRQTLAFCPYLSDTIRVWSLLQMQARTIASQVRVCGLALSGSTDSLVASRFDGGGMQLWRLTGQSESDRVPGVPPSNRMAFAEAGRYLVAGNEPSGFETGIKGIDLIHMRLHDAKPQDTRVTVWDLDTGTCVETTDGYGDTLGIALALKRHRAIVHGSELAIIEPNGDRDIAWFPAAPRIVRTHPTAPIWAGALGNRLWIWHLETCHPVAGLL